MKPTATTAELAILERARRQPRHDARPAPAPLTLTSPVRRPVQASLFGGCLALGVAGEPPARTGRHLQLVQRS
jgi:hypothetical protein